MRAALRGSGQQHVGGLGCLQTPAAPTGAQAMLEWPKPEGKSELEERAVWGMLQYFFGAEPGKSKALPDRSCLWTPWFGLTYPAGSYSEMPMHRSKLDMQGEWAVKAPRGSCLCKASVQAGERGEVVSTP